VDVMPSTGEVHGRRPAEIPVATEDEDAHGGSSLL